jgi:signal transduction histidine kinase
MKKFLLLFFFFFSPSTVWGYVPHEYPAIYTHQLGRIFLLVAFISVLVAMISNHLHKKKGWRYLYFSLIFFTIWDLNVFIARVAEFIEMPQTIGSMEGWQYFARNINIQEFEYLYYMGRLDFILLNVAMFLFYLGLREHLKEKKGSVSIYVVLPLLPILITDIAGNIIFVMLSVMSLNTSIKLYKKDKENALWNYMVWLSSTWVMLSISRSFGHVLRHILIPAGKKDIWVALEPVAGSFNSLAIFLVGSVSLFFIWIYRSYLEISEEKRKLENLVKERTEFIEQLERDKMELKELDKLKSAFLATVSHELRTPMNSVIGYTELLLDRVDGPLTREQEGSLKKVEANAKHLLRLIDDILNISKIESGKLRLNIREIDINKLIETTSLSFEPLIKQKGLIFILELAKKLPFVYGDEDRIRQVLVNLLSNAVKFTHRGVITVNSRISEKGIQTDGQPLFIEICVTDTGIGIEKHNLEKIFDKFVQVDFTTVRQYEGSGLGLTIAKGIVELHRGQIWATSKSGEGSKFCFTLPVKKELLEERIHLTPGDVNVGKEFKDSTFK